MRPSCSSIRLFAGCARDGDLERLEPVSFVGMLRLRVGWSEFGLRKRSRGRSARAGRGGLISDMGDATLWPRMQKAVDTRRDMSRHAVTHVLIINSCYYVKYACATQARSSNYQVTRWCLEIIKVTV